MAKESDACIGPFTGRWTSSPTPVQLVGPTCLSFLFRSSLSYCHWYSNTVESVNIEISLRYGFRKLLREILLFSHITGSCCCWQLATAAQGLAAAILQGCSWPPAPGSWSCAPLLCLLLFPCVLLPLSVVYLFVVFQAHSLVSKTFLLWLSYNCFFSINTPISTRGKEGPLPTWALKYSQWSQLDGCLCMVLMTSVKHNP